MHALIKQRLGLSEHTKIGSKVGFCYNFENSNLIAPLEDVYSIYAGKSDRMIDGISIDSYCRYKSSLERYDGFNLIGKFTGFSRIDGIEIISVDLDLIRNDRIDKILESIK
jgi:hypothetical protein